MVKLPLAGAKLRVQVHVPGEIIEEDGHLVINRGRSILTTAMGSQYTRK